MPSGIADSIGIITSVGMRFLSGRTSGSVSAAVSRAPTLFIALGAATILLLEHVRGGGVAAASGKWLTVEAAVAAGALLLAWPGRHRLRLPPLLLVVGVFQLALVVIHIRHGLPGDSDVRDVYSAEGNSLLHGDYPRSEYPPGAVVVFALDALLGGGPTRDAHAFVMIPFNLVAVAAIWSLRTRPAAWLAACWAMLPGTFYFWEYRFDLVPASLLAAGLALGYHGRDRVAAVVLALGTWVKWLPAISSGAFALWLARPRTRRRDAVTFLALFAGVVVVLNLPFLILSPGNFLASYTTQGGRGITAESFPYLPLRALGLAHVPDGRHIWDEAVRPGWADTAAVVVQAVLLAGSALACMRASSRTAAIAIAALVPGVFALTNRVFSGQFVLVIAVGWLVASALLCRTRAQQLAAGATVSVATYANALVYPARINHWLTASAGFFLCATVMTLALVVAARSPAGPAGELPQRY